eukprot:6849953-Pyramimonas_sp.AAC.1
MLEIQVPLGYSLPRLPTHHPPRPHPPSRTPRPCNHAKEFPRRPGPPHLRGGAMGSHSPQGGDTPVGHSGSESRQTES